MSWLDEQIADVAKSLDDALGTKVVDAIQTISGVVGPIVGYYYGGSFGAAGASAFQDRLNMYTAIGRGADPKAAKKAHYKNAATSLALAAVVYGLQRATDTTMAGRYAGKSAPAGTTAAAGTDAAAQAGSGPPTSEVTGVQQAPAQSATPDGFTPTEPANVMPAGGGSQAPASTGVMGKVGAAWEGLGETGRGMAIYGGMQLAGGLLQGANEPTSGEEAEEILAAKQRANRYSGRVSGGAAGRFAVRPTTGASSVNVLTPQQMLSAGGFGQQFDPTNPTAGLLEPTNIAGRGGY